MENLINWLERIRKQWAPWFRLMGLFKYLLLFSLGLFLLPLTVSPDFPAHNALGSLFVGQSGPQAFWLTLVLMNLCWGIMFMAAMLVKSRAGMRTTVSPRPFWHPTGSTDTQNIEKLGEPRFPLAAENFFSINVTWRQFGAFLALSIPALMVTLFHAPSAGWAMLGILAGWLVFWLVNVLVWCGLWRSDPGQSSGWHPLPAGMLECPLRLLCRLGMQQQGGGRLRRFIERAWMALFLFSWKRARELTVPECHARWTAQLPWIICVMNFVMITFGYLMFGLLFKPGTPCEPSAAGYFLGLWLPLVWLTGYLQSILRRWNISLLLVVVPAWLAGQFLLALADRDHEFQVAAVWYFNQETVGPVAATPTALVQSNVSLRKPIVVVEVTGNKLAAAQPLSSTLPVTPIDVAKHSSNNLVVVTATGGGILAAGWTTLALEQLITNRPELAGEIKLISGASGGSVGAAFYIAGLGDAIKHWTNQWGWGRAACRTQLVTSGVLRQVFSNATESSLGPIIYGMSFRDAWRPVFGLAIKDFEDRGWELERAFQRNSRRTNDLQEEPLWSDLQEDLKAGHLPAVIFGSTVLETGERIMLTPLHFESPCQEVLTNREEEAGLRYGRGFTLGEYWTNHCWVNMSLWTAARMSATFPYVSPAARPRLQRSLLKHTVRAQHHLVDGGYNENYGVAAALDWLTEVLEAKKKDPNLLPNLKRVLIIELRAFSEQSPPAQKPAAAAFLGPPIALLHVFEASAQMRNEIDVTRFIKGWSERLTNVQFQSVVFERPSSTGPLSWQLSAAEKESLRASWLNQDIVEACDQVRRFLSGRSETNTGRTPSP